MRQAIRAVGWATNIFWIILLSFTVTAVYSAFQLSPEFGKHYINTLDGALTVSFPFYLNNGGFYDISNMNITTLIKDNYGSPISDSSTFVPLIPKGSNISVTHNVSMSLSQMTVKYLSHMLFNDTILDIDVSWKINYAKVVPFEVSTNLTMPWGAPLSNLTIGDIYPSPYNSTRAIVPISFQNHSPCSLDGTTRLELVDNANHLLGSGVGSIPPMGGYIPIEVFVPDLTNIRQARLYFVTSFFSYGPLVIPLV